MTEPWKRDGDGISYTAAFPLLNRSFSFDDAKLPNSVEEFLQDLAKVALGLFVVSVKDDVVSFETGDFSRDEPIYAYIEGILAEKIAWSRLASIRSRTFSEFMISAFLCGLQRENLEVGDIQQIKVGKQKIYIELKENLCYHSLKPIKIGEDVVAVTPNVKAGGLVWGKNELAWNRVVLSPDIDVLKCDFGAVLSQLEAHDDSIRSWLCSLRRSHRCDECKAFRENLADTDRKPGTADVDPQLGPDSSIPKHDPDHWGTVWPQLTVHAFEACRDKAKSPIATALESITKIQCHKLVKLYTAEKEGANCPEITWLEDVSPPFEELIRAFPMGLPAQHIPVLEKLCIPPVKYSGVVSRINNTRSHICSTVFQEVATSQRTACRLGLAPDGMCGLLCPPEIGCAMTLPFLYLEAPRIAPGAKLETHQSSTVNATEKFAVPRPKKKKADMANIYSPRDLLDDKDSKDTQAFTPPTQDTVEVSYDVSSDSTKYDVTTKIRSGNAVLEEVVSALPAGPHTCSDGVKLCIEALCSLKMLYTLTGRTDFLFATLLAGDGQIQLRICGFDSTVKVFRCCMYACLDLRSFSPIDLSNFVMACCRVGIMLAAQVERMSLLKFDVQRLIVFNFVIRDLPVKTVADRDRKYVPADAISSQGHSYFSDDDVTSSHIEYDNDDDDGDLSAHDSDDDAQSHERKRKAARRLPRSPKSKKKKRGHRGRQTSKGADVTMNVAQGFVTKVANVAEYDVYNYLLSLPAQPSWLLKPLSITPHPRRSNRWNIVLPLVLETKLTRENLPSYIRGLFKAMSELHELLIFHGDLKEPNILYGTMQQQTTSDTLHAEPQIFIIDFGHSELMSSRDQLFRGRRGTNGYQNFAVVWDGDYGLDADYYALGCMMENLAVYAPDSMRVAVQNWASDLRCMMVTFDEIVNFCDAIIIQSFAGHAWRRFIGGTYRLTVDCALKDAKGVSVSPKLMNSFAHDLTICSVDTEGYPVTV